MDGAVVTMTKKERGSAKNTKQGVTTHCHPPFLFVIVTTAPSISGSPPGGPRLWCSFALGMGEFQFYSDASEYFTGVRNLDLVRELNPELQPLDTWLTQHKNEIPLD